MKAAKYILFIGSIALIVAAIVIMAQPDSTFLVFVPDSGDTIDVPSSYFNIMILLGYANFGPPLTAIFSVLWLALSVLNLVLRSGVNKRVVKVFASVTAVLSAMTLLTMITPPPLAFGIFGFITAAAALQIVVWRSTGQQKNPA